MCKSNWVKAVLIVATAFGGWNAGTRWSFFTVVYGSSMEPTLRSGQLFRVHHTIPRAIERGTVVLVSRPGLPPLIKRVVGLPNETVSFHLGEVFVDGRMLREPYIPEQWTTFSWNHERIALGPDQYLVLGDNRPSSQDSRDYGPVLRSDIIGTIQVAHAPIEFLATPYYRIMAGSKSAVYGPQSPRPNQRAISSSAIAVGFR